jgi:hypothetical protein
MPTLSITDNADGTGATATIAGSGGAANTIFVLTVDGTVETGTWAPTGSLVGDGTVSLPLPKGYYFGYALSAPATLSGVAYFGVTAGSDSVAARCFAAVATRLQLLALPCTANVYDSLYADNKAALQYPCVVLTTDGARDTDEAATNGRDDIGHGVRVLIKDVCFRFDEARRDTYRSWRQAILRAFLNQRLPGVPESVRCKVELGSVAAVATDRPQVVTELTIRCVTREPRGLGA